MSFGACWANGCFAAGGFTAIQNVMTLLLQLLLGAAGLILGWFLGAPLARVLYRLAFQKPIPPKVLTVARLGTAIVCAVLLFFMPLLFGLGGGGRGNTTGPGDGSGTDAGKDLGDKGKGKGGKDGKGKGVTPGLEGETLRVQLIASAKYNSDQRWYLLDQSAKPRTLAEVEAYLKTNKGRVRTLEILLSGETPASRHPAVRDLRDLAARNNLPVLERYTDEDGKKSK
jgi:hypothetical protein